MRALVTVPWLLTAGNAAMGLLAIVAALQGRTSVAAVLIVGAGVLDLLDGPMARAVGSSSRHGAIADTIADFISFGAGALVLLVVAGERGTDALVAAALGAVWGVAVAFRLLRFLREPGAGGHTIGLPAPPAAGSLAVVVWNGDHGLPGVSESALSWLVMGAGCALAVLMASRIPYPTIGTYPLDRLNRLLYVSIPALALWFVAFEWTSLLFTVAYLSTGPVAMMRRKMGVTADP